MEKVRSKLSSGVVDFVAQLEVFLDFTCSNVFSNISAAPGAVFASLQECSAALHLWLFREDVAING